MIQRHEWEARQSPLADLAPGTPVRVGLDVGSTVDTTAVVPIAFQDGKHLIGDPIILAPPAEDGESTDFRAIRAAVLVMAGKVPFDRDEFIQELGEENPRGAVEEWADAIEPYADNALEVVSVSFDPRLATQLSQELSLAYGLRFVTFDQNATSLVRMTQGFMEAFRSGKILHSGHEGMTTHVMNTKEVPAADSYYFGRPKKGRGAGKRLPIDAMTAAAMAHDAGVRHGGTAKPAPKRKAQLFFA